MIPTLSSAATPPLAPSPAGQVPGNSGSGGDFERVLGKASHGAKHHRAAKVKELGHDPAETPAKGAESAPIVPVDDPAKAAAIIGDAAQRNAAEKVVDVSDPTGSFGPEKALDSVSGNQRKIDVSAMAKTEDQISDFDAKKLTENQSADKKVAQEIGAEIDAKVTVKPEPSPRSEKSAEEARFLWRAGAVLDEKRDDSAQQGAGDSGPATEPPALVETPPPIAAPSSHQPRPTALPQPFFPIAAAIHAKAALPAADPARHQGTELLLNPAELGRIRFDLVGTGPALTISITAERAETATLLQRHAAELRAELSGAGLEQADLSFAGWGQDRRAETQKAPAPMPEMAQDPAPVTPPPPPRPQTRSGGVDLRL